MPDTLTILRQRHARRDNARRSAENSVRRFVIGAGFALSVLLAAGILGTAFAWVSLAHDLPPVEMLPALLDAQTGALLQPTRFYDRTGGQVITVLAPNNDPRKYITLEEIPVFLQQATLAALDPAFEQHNGYLLSGLNEPDKHPTLAQRLAADLLLWDEAPSLRRAIRERLLAAQITRRYGRSQVLEWFLNSADYGNYAYGVDAAARLYFGKPAAELGQAESALLAGISRSPALNPLASPQDIPIIQRDIAMLMLDGNRATPEEAALAAATPVVIQPPPTPINLSPAFSELVLAQLGEQYSPQRIARGGIQVTTTLDAGLQNEVGCAIAAQLARLSGNEGTVPECAAGLQLPNLPAGMTTSEPVLAAIVTDPKTGEVLAYSGETKNNGSQAGMTKRPIGSLVNPFIYFTGLARAGLNPASMVWDIPGGISGEVEKRPGEYHGPMRLRTALASGLFTPTIELVNQLGAPQIARNAQFFGLSLSENRETLINGETLVSLPTLAHAFGIFANQGVLAGRAHGEEIIPLVILKVETADHVVWQQNTQGSVQAITSPQLSYLVTDMLRDPIARRYAPGMPAFLDLGRPAAAISGASPDERTAWTAGYTPDRVVVTWLGSSSTAPQAATQSLWHGILLAAIKNLPPSAWSAPQGIVQADVCERSGLLPTIYCPEIVREIFLSENAPLQYDTLFRAYMVNRETGLLATAFTPPALVEEKVFMDVPEQARQWAQATGLETPPDTYDTVQVEPPNPDVVFSSPAMFDYVRGVVTLKGTASGADFESYRLDAGMGINPRHWLTITPESTTPITDGVLGSWDTSGLDGLYTLRLSLVRAGQKLETATLMVTVDNSSPEISLTFPKNNETLALSESKEITIFPTITDNIAVTSVDFFIDGMLLEKRTSEPFAARWQASAGGHTLRIVASDAAGNRSDFNLEFSVTK